MPTKVLKSRIAGIPDFEAAVKSAAEERTLWRAHMAMVGKNPNEYTPYPAPQPHPEIARAIAEVPGRDGEPETYAPDYEIEDDSPPPENILRQRKNVLIEIVSRLEHMATAQVSPPGKRRLWQIREQDIRVADQTVSAEHVESHTEKRRARIRKLGVEKRKDLVAVQDALGPELDAEDLAKLVEKDRDAGDTAFLAEQAARAAKLTAIARHGAQLHSDIEDLEDDAAISAFEIKPFPV